MEKIIIEVNIYQKKQGKRKLLRDGYVQDLPLFCDIVSQDRLRVLASEKFKEKLDDYIKEYINAKR